MLKRKIVKQLEEWKKSEEKTCLVIKGARQIGKTYIIDYFAKTNYENYVYINFIENEDAKEAFAGNLNIDEIIMKLSVIYTDVEMIPYKTVIFLDELQCCPRARTALKFFALDKRFDVIASGSLLGLNYNEVSSYPVGYEEVVEMFSLDFEEFLWAIGVKKDTILYLKDCLQKQQPVMDVIHEKMKSYFLWYILVGGMPAVVNEFLKQKNFHNVLKVQRMILQGYLDDISKYAKLSDKIKARECFLSIPQQLSKPNKKFQYSLLEEYGQKKKYESSLQWLYDAGIISYCYNVSEPRLPLMTHKISSKFKVYMKDTGLLIAMMEEGTQQAILSENLNLNNGAVYENIISEVLLKNNRELFYFERKGKLEIDFLLNLNGQLTAIEVKSGDNQMAKSLSVLLSDKYHVPFGIKLTKDNLEEKDKILKLPFYMVMFL